MPNLRIEAKRIRPPADWKYVGEVGWQGRVPWWRLLCWLAAFVSEFLALAQEESNRKPYAHLTADSQPE